MLLGGVEGKEHRKAGALTSHSGARSFLKRSFFNNDEKVFPKYL